MMECLITYQYSKTNTWKPIHLDSISKVYDAVISPFTEQVWFKPHLPSIVRKVFNEVLDKIGECIKHLEENDSEKFVDEIERLHNIYINVLSYMSNIAFYSHDYFKKDEWDIHELNNEFYEAIKNGNVEEFLRSKGFIRIK